MYLSVTTGPAGNPAPEVIQLQRVFTGTKSAIPFPVPALLAAGYPRRLGGDTPHAHLGEVQLTGSRQPRKTCFDLFNELPIAKDEKKGAWQLANLGSAINVVF